MSKKDNLLVHNYPEIAAQFHPNKNGDLKVEDLTYGSGKKIWWLCMDCGSEYDSRIVDRGRGNGCPYCDGKKVNHTNCLATTHPDLLLQWNFEKNENLTPYEIIAGTSKKVWWKCPKCDSDYEMTGTNKINHNQNCPFCRGLKVNHTNSLATKYPYLENEWDCERNKLTPHDITFGSGKYAWWTCERGHNWRAIICDRAGKGKGCPQCKESKGERRISFYLEKNNFIFKPQYRLKNCRYKQSLLFDFAIFNRNNQLQFLIEFDGGQHFKPVKWFGGEEGFKDTKIRDEIKNTYCKENSISLIRIPYWEYDNIEGYLKSELSKINNYIHNEYIKIS